MLARARASNPNIPSIMAALRCGASESRSRPASILTLKTGKFLSSDWASRATAATSADGSSPRAHQECRPGLVMLLEWGVKVHARRFGQFLILDVLGHSDDLRIGIVSL